MEKNEKLSHKWNIIVVSVSLLLFAFLGGITIYIDPLFHYHAPLDKYEYPIDDERYQNDGIVRHFKYNAVITGTSMVENFETSQCNQLFGKDEEIIFIKVPFAGAPYREVNECLKRAFQSNPNIKFVIRSLDNAYLVEDKDAVWDGITQYGYPEYLVNNNPFDDVEYLLNKDILFEKTLRVCDYTYQGKKTPSFDEYMSWSDDMNYGREAILEEYMRSEKAPVKRKYVQTDNVKMIDNLHQNVISLSEQHKDTTFYLFFPPYSILYWDKLNQRGEVEWRIEAEKNAIEELINYSNIKLYSFCTEYDMICDLNNYRDPYHYGGWINKKMLEWMSQDIHQITKENYQEYISQMYNFYGTYNYEALYDE